jgi:hypothetical protein
MAQFIGIMIHGFQLAFLDDCGFPRQFSYYIAAHAVLFFCLFTEFYVRAYIAPKKREDNDKAKLDQLSSKQMSNKAKEKAN